MLGIGIIGAGFIADIHARVYRELAGLGVEMVAIHSRSLDRAQALAERYGIAQVVADLDQLLASPRISLVDLCVPNHLHEPFAVRAAQAGKHVLCEKPLTGYFGQEEATAAETPRLTMLTEALGSATRMLAAVERYGVRIFYGENLIYAPAIQKALRLARASGGVILEMQGEESHHGSHAAYAKQWHSSGGGSLLRLGVHPIGVALYLKADEGRRRNSRPIRVRSVTAEVADLSKIAAWPSGPQEWIVHDWVDVENWASVILTFEDGTKGVFLASDVTLGGMEDTFQVRLSNCRIVCNLSRNTQCQAFAPDPGIFADEYLAEKLETKAGWSFPSLDEERLLGYHDELRDFVEALQQNRPPLSDGYLGRDVVEVVYSAYLSAAEGRTVYLPVTSPA
ncbi:MAG: Gfo/Idh/MocA family oxidoreductase [Chloroflexi bacterium]|nr:Gfo/Idh/MocA family oxidoreductase [Chloroflexota bacterium]